MAPTDSDILLPLPSAEDPEPTPAGAGPAPGSAETFAFLDDPPPASATDAATDAETDPESDTQQTATLQSDSLAIIHGRPADDDTPLPQVPGYEVLARLGRGGMGEVLLADRIADAGLRLRLRCALKLVHPGRRHDPVYVGQILSEARIIAQLRHPNIVSILDVGRVGDQVWLAMEWVDGCDSRSLRRMARDRDTAIPLRHVVYVIRDALQGLHHAHQARGTDGRALGIVHRDLSPGNILISRHGAVKLADFGVAAARADGPARLRLVGKPQYLAPELYRGAEASVQSDIFALGATLWELLTMEPLFARSLSFDEAMARVTSFDPRRVIAADLTLPDGVEPILLRALAPNPDQRYDSALMMLEDVSDFAYEAGLRLLDAHFARYVQRALDAVPAGR